MSLRPHPSLPTPRCPPFLTQHLRDFTSDAVVPLHPTISALSPLLSSSCLPSATSFTTIPSCVTLPILSSLYSSVTHFVSNAYSQYLNIATHSLVALVHFLHFALIYSLSFLFFINSIHKDIRRLPKDRLPTWKPLRISYPPIPFPLNKSSEPPFKALSCLLQLLYFLRLSNTILANLFLPRFPYWTRIYLIYALWCVFLHPFFSVSTLSKSLLIFMTL